MLMWKDCVDMERLCWCGKIVLIWKDCVDVERMCWCEKGTLPL